MKREALLDLNEALQHPGKKIAVDIETELTEEEDLDLVEPLKGYLEAVSTGNMLLVDGEFEGEVIVECSRCSYPLRQRVRFVVDEQFPVVGVPSSFNPRESAHVEADEPYPLFEGNSLLVENLIRQDLAVNLPVQPLCEFGWDGDCPHAKTVDQRRQASQVPSPELKGLARYLHNEDSNT